MTQLPKPGDVFHRRVTVERDALATRAAGDERIPISISSELPVDRYFGREILVHTKDAINLEHAVDGLPFLADHDSTRQIGLVEDVSLRADGKLAGKLRKGNHPDADWYFKDIEAGIRRNISVGYRIDSLTPDEKDGNTFRADRWTPMETSTVSVPADITVGAGRSQDTLHIPIRFEIEKMPVSPYAVNILDGGDGKTKREEGTNVGPCANDGCNHDFASHQDEGMQCQADGCACPGYVQSPNTPEPRAAKTKSPAPRPKERTMSDEVTGSDAAPAHKAGPKAVSFAEKQQEMANIARLAETHGMQSELASWFERGLSRDQVAAEILERKPKPEPTSVPGHLDLSERDAMKFSYTRAMTNILTKNWDAKGGFEKEVSDAVAKRSNRSTSGFFVPLDLKILSRTAVTGNIAATSSLGGAGVQTSVLSLIDILRNKMLVRQLGATVLSGLTGNITFPRHIVANTMAWEGENPSTAHAHTAATFDNVALSPKTAMASSAYSRQLLIQESFDISNFIQNDLATVLAVGLDLAAIDGTGSNNQPTGIMRQTNVTSIVHTGTAAGGVPTWAEMVSYETNVATNNADIGTFHWLTTPGVRGKLKTVLKSTTAGSTYLWESDNTINGYAAHASNQVPSGLTYGTSTTVAHGIVFGNWAELLIGEWGGALEVIVDPYTAASQNMVVITQMILADIAVKHPKSFAVTKSALIA
jgi:HK97 family phage major capsid protein